MTSGVAAEQAACQFLQQQGLNLVARNYRCRQGELDLIMLDKQTLVFVEVRLRSHSTFGGAVASVTAAKQRKLIQAARHFLSQYAESRPCRFDILAFEPSQPTPIWIRHAFAVVDSSF